MILVKELSVEDQTKKYLKILTCLKKKKKKVKRFWQNNLLKTIINIIEPSSGSIYWKENH